MSYAPTWVYGTVWLSKKFHLIPFNHDSLRQLKINNLIRHNPCPQEAQNLELRFKSHCKETQLLFSAWTAIRR